MSATDPTVQLPIEAWVEVLSAMKRRVVNGCREGGELPYPMNDQWFCHALAKIQLAVDSEPL